MEPRTYSGVLISVEGIDGSGKTSLINSFESFLTSKDVKVYTTKSPTPFYFGNSHVERFLTTGVKNVSHQSMALFSASDKLFQLDVEVLPKLKEGYLVIMDRYLLSAYVSFASRGILKDWILEINKYALQPDISFILNCDALVAQERIFARKNEKISFDEKSIDVLRSKQQLFISFSKKEDYIIDAQECANSVFSKCSEILIKELKSKYKFPID